MPCYSACNPCLVTVRATHALLQCVQPMPCYSACNPCLVTVRATHALLQCVQPMPPFSLCWLLQSRLLGSFHSKSRPSRWSPCQHPPTSSPPVSPMEPVRCGRWCPTLATQKLLPLLLWLTHQNWYRPQKLTLEVRVCCVVDVGCACMVNTSPWWLNEKNKWNKLRSIEVVRIEDCRKP